MLFIMKIYVCIRVFAFWGEIWHLTAALLALLFVFMFDLIVWVHLFTTHELSNPELQLWSQEEGREYKKKEEKKKKRKSSVGWKFWLFIYSVIRAARRRPDPSSRAVRWLSGDSRRAPRSCASGAAGCVRSGAAVQRGGSRSSGQS